MMDDVYRSKMARYIASAIRYATKETGVEWPEDTILVTQSYNELSEIDEIIGMKIYVMNMPSCYDLFVAFKSDNVSKYDLQKSFLEYIEMYSEDNFHRG